MTTDILLCGGTIDKAYFPEREVFDFNKTHINEMLAQARIPDVNVNIRFLMAKDSLDMDDSDRMRIARACKESLSHRIMVMHGTSTMIKTAKTISEEFSGGKTIIFFGSMLPYELAKSDAMFNFGGALVASQVLDSGVYIAMNGRVWTYDQVVKNEETATFVDAA